MCHLTGNMEIVSPGWSTLSWLCELLEILETSKDVVGCTAAPAAQPGKEVGSWDIPGAYLHANLGRTVYTATPLDPVSIVLSRITTSASRERHAKGPTSSGAGIIVVSDPDTGCVQDVQIRGQVATLSLPCQCTEMYPGQSLRMSLSGAGPH